MLWEMFLQERAIQVSVGIIFVIGLCIDALVITLKMTWSDRHSEAIERQEEIDRLVQVKYASCSGM
jgi:hypothetical protein